MANGGYFGPGFEGMDQFQMSQQFQYIKFCFCELFC